MTESRLASLCWRTPAAISSFGCERQFGRYGTANDEADDRDKLTESDPAYAALLRTSLSGPDAPERDRGDGNVLRPSPKPATRLSSRPATNPRLTARTSTPPARRRAAPGAATVRKAPVGADTDGPGCDRTKALIAMRRAVPAGPARRQAPTRLRQAAAAMAKVSCLGERKCPVSVRNEVTNAITQGGPCESAGPACFLHGFQASANKRLRQADGRGAPRLPVAVGAFRRRQGSRGSGGRGVREVAKGTWDGRRRVLAGGLRRSSWDSTGTRP